jgi:D-beta-D-heptose 7-phosphate kinase/D-beta-D-heptose 1-phosphate adenosyltransferase
VNLAALGAKTSCLAVLGDDAEAHCLCRSLVERGVATDALVTQSGRRTIAKHRIVAAGQLLLRFGQGDTGSIAVDAERALIDRLTDRHARCDALLVSDYGYGTPTPAVLHALAALQARRPRVLVVDPRQRLAEFRRVAPTAVKPNEEEARRCWRRWRASIT